MKKYLGMFAAGVLLALLLAGCAEDTGQAGRPLKMCKIVLLLPGDTDDLSWNETNYEGILSCEEQLGLRIECVENTQEADFETVLSDYGAQGFDLVFAAGAQFDDAVASVAPKYPGTMFCVINGTRQDEDNVLSVFPKEYEASYLASIIAGNIAQDGSLGIIAGYPNTAMEHLLDIYEKNTRRILKERGIQNIHVYRAYTNDWSNRDLSGKIAEQVIGSGGKLLFVYTNDAGLACIEAAEKEGAKVIGFCGNPTKTHPETAVASIQFDFGVIYRMVLELFEKGELSGNRVYEVGINEDVFIPVYSESIPEDVRQKVDQAVSDFKDGKINLERMFP